MRVQINITISIKLLKLGCDLTEYFMNKQKELYHKIVSDFKYKINIFCCSQKILFSIFVFKSIIK